jgi:hypothetical protein
MNTQDLVKVNKDYFVVVAQTALKTAVYTALPYLNVPPINVLLNKLINWLISKVADGLELAMFFIYVDLRISLEGADYVTAAQKANKTQLPEDIKVANEKFKIFIKFVPIK